MARLCSRFGGQDFERGVIDKKKWSGADFDASVEVGAVIERTWFGGSRGSRLPHPRGKVAQEFRREYQRLKRIVI
jgi:hypothetical protein